MAKGWAIYLCSALDVFSVASDEAGLLVGVLVRHDSQMFCKVARKCVVCVNS